MKFCRIALLSALSLFLMAACNEEYSVKLSVSPKTMAVGGSGKIQIKIKACGKWHINADSPAVIKFTPPEGVTMDKDELTEADRQPENTFNAGFKVGDKAKSGPAVIKAQVFFMMCKADMCKMIDEEHLAKFDIK